MQQFLLCLIDSSVTSRVVRGLLVLPLKIGCMQGYYACTADERVFFPGISPLPTTIDKDRESQYCTHVKEWTVDAVRADTSSLASW